MSGLTPSQTVGPYFKIGLDWPHAYRLTESSHAFAITGQVLDGDGVPVPDALIEIWQADVSGRYDSETFAGSGRCAAGAAGEFRFVTMKPGSVDDGQGARQAPHINVAIFARGLLTHLYTRIYFPEDHALHANDAVLACVPQARRASLVALREGNGYRFDIRLQGVNETVFFEF